jgi:hypothetical protein
MRIHLFSTLLGLLSVHTARSFNLLNSMLLIFSLSNLMTNYPSRPNLHYTKVIVLVVSSCFDGWGNNSL